MNVPLWSGRVVQGLAVLACLLTAASAIHSNVWWIRVLDFPRTSMLGAIAVLLLACSLLVRTGRMLTIVMLCVAGSYHAWRIRDYTPLAATELSVDVAADDPAACFTALGFNVLQHNRDYDATLAMLQREQPELLLLMETDSLWLSALRPVLATYTHVSQRALSNRYGMIFASRMPVRNARFEHPTSANTPTFYATVTTPGGESFDFVGLHPRPPLPGQGTAQRDASIARAARRQASDRTPALAMGDFNDVAWSRTTQEFALSGGYLDARVGRGLYATFPSTRLAVGWSLDHSFVTAAFTVGDVRVLEHVGSDHRALATRLCLRSDSLVSQAKPATGQHAGGASTR